MKINCLFVVGMTVIVTGFAGTVHPSSAAEPIADPVVTVWPNSPPTWDAPTQPESDTSGPHDRSVAGQPVIRLGHVSIPQLHVFAAKDAAGQPSSTIVVVCPGGGYNILAWDLEGTEIAQQFQASGVTAVVLKYRVPTRPRDDRWTPVIQDIQRSIALCRSGAVTGSVPTHVGVMGFSAGGNAAARAATTTQRTYESVDDADATITPPDFACLIYPAWLVQEDDPDTLQDGITINAQTPPMFLAHAENDGLTVMNVVTTFTRLHQAGVPAALHVFTGSGHGFGSREDGRADDLWMPLCVRWLHDAGFTP